MCVHCTIPADERDPMMRSARGIRPAAVRAIRRRRATFRVSHDGTPSRTFRVRWVDCMTALAVSGLAYWAGWAALEWLSR